MKMINERFPYITINDDLQSQFLEIIAAVVQLKFKFNSKCIPTVSVTTQIRNA